MAGSGALYYVAYTYPSQQAVIKWDVGLGLFDGQWHTVAICFNGENKHLRTVKLYIDGYTTARTGDRWLQCASHFGDAVAHPVRGSPALQPAFVSSPTESVYGGGLLVLGAINASLFNVQFFPRAFTQEDVIAAGAPWMYTQPPGPKAHGVCHRQACCLSVRSPSASALHYKCCLRYCPHSRGHPRYRRRKRPGAWSTEQPQRLVRSRRRRRRCQATVSAAAAASRTIQRADSRRTRSLRRSRWRWVYSRGSACTSRGGSGRRRFVAECSYLFSYIAFDLAFWVYAPPYVILLLQTALVFVCAAFVRAMTLREPQKISRKPWIATKLRAWRRLTSYAKHFLKALPDVFCDEALLAKACTAIVSERKAAWTPERLCGLGLARSHPCR